MMLRKPTRSPVRFVAVVLALTLCVAACGGDDPVVVDDADTGGPTPDTVEPDTGPPAPLPECQVLITPREAAGNAPLTVAFDAEVTGDVTTSLLEYLWVVDESTTYDTQAMEHTFYKKGTAKVDLTVTFRSPDGRLSTCIDSVQVKVAGCADLFFDQVTLNPPVEVAPGDSVTLKTGALFNDGDRVDVPFKVQVVLSGNEVYDPEEDLVVSEWEVPEMEAGTFSESKIDYAGQAFTVPELPDGNYFVFLVADGEAVVNECKEDNNVATSTNNLTIDPATALKPDLTMINVEAPAGAVVQEGDIFNYKFRVENQGEGDATQFKLAFYMSTDQNLDPETDIQMFGPTDIGATMQQMTAGGGQSFSKSFKMPAEIPDGSYWLIGQVDVNEQVLEDDETNNVAVSASPITVQFEEVKCFDLAFDDLYVAPLASYWNGSVNVTATVSNPGTVASPDGWPMNAYLSLQPTLNPAIATPVGSWSLPSIPAGETVEITQVINIPSNLPVLPHYVGVILDTDALLDECAEGNNAQSFPDPVSIDAQANVDVSASDLFFHPKNITAGESFKVTYQLANDGSTGSGAFKVAVVLSQDGNFSKKDAKNGTDQIIHQVVVDNVDPAVSVERVEDVVMPIELDHETPTWYLAVIADLDDNIGSDNNNSNDIAVAGEQITVEGAQGGCFEDENEPNNLPGDATVLTEGLHEGLGSCGNHDWYSVTVPAGHSLIVEMTIYELLSIDPVSPNLNLTLNALGPTPIDTSTNVGLAEEVHVFTVPQETEFLIEVFGATGAAQALYDLNIEIKEPVDGIDLLPVDVTALPGTLYPGGLINVSWDDVNLGDTAGGPHRAEIWASEDLEFDGSDVLVADVELSGVPALTSIPRSVDFLVPVDIPGGDWRFLVVQDVDDQVAEADENNNVGWSDSVELDPLLTCDDDGLEPNNDIELATPLDVSAGAASLSEQVVCPKLEDWFAVDVAEGQSLTAKVTYKYKAAKGELRMEIWDPYKTAMLVHQVEQDTVQVSIPWVWRTGTYYVRVSNDPTAPNAAPYDYSLVVTAGAGDPLSMCDADVFEDNNAAQQAKYIGCGFQQATMCKADVDVYRLELKQFDNLVITLNQSKAELRMALYEDPNGPAVQSKTGNGAITYQATQDLTVFLRVEPKDALSVTDFNYSLFMDGLAGVDLTVNEPELYFTDVYQGEDNELTFEVVNSCVDPSGAFTAAVWLSKDTTLDVTDVELGTVELEGVEGKSTLEVTEKVQVPFSTEPGPYYLLVEADTTDAVLESNEDNNTNASPLGVAKLCLPDALEPNDILSPSEPWAPVVAPPGVDNLALCPFELDWMAFEVPGGTTLTVTARFSHDEGDLDLRLYDPNYSTTIPVETAASKTDDETLVYNVAVAGTYLLRVHGFDGSSAEYDLELTYD